MNNIKHITILTAAILLTGCGVFKPYSNKESVPENIFGTDAYVSTGDTCTGDISWREFFTDSYLQALIDSALVRNADLAVAELNVKQAETALRAAKLNFLPSLSFNPAIEFSGANNYSLPFNIGWDNQGIGSLANRKKEAEAFAKLSGDTKDLVKSQLVAAVAKAYSQLQLLYTQLDILAATEEVWTKVCQTQQALMDNGKAYSPSVRQLEAALAGVKIQRLDAESQLRETENAMCMLLSMPPQKIELVKRDNFTLPEKFETGLPVTVLSRRPDVRAAGHNVEVAYYINRQALAAMFPGISISGLVGWQNGGAALSDPLTMIYKAIAGLSQPIFARGQLKANLDATRLEQEAAARKYSQVILEAGNEVNNALRNCQLASEKDKLYKQQVVSLKDAYSATTELMTNGKASYIETLMAQDNLLNAQLGEAVNIYDGVANLIDLYIALGGGVD